MEQVSMRYQHPAWLDSEKVTLEAKKVGYNPDYEGFALIWSNDGKQRTTHLALKQHVISIDVIQEQN